MISDSASQSRWQSVRPSSPRYPLLVWSDDLGTQIVAYVMVESTSLGFTSIQTIVKITACALNWSFTDVSKVLR